MKILVINPGSTSTKVAIFEDEKQIDLKVLRHSPEELSNFKTLWEQFDFRLKIILDFLEEKNLKPSDFSAVVGIGGLLRPVKGGTYRVNDKMLEDARANFQGEHPSNLGCALAYEIAKLGGVDAFIVDPVSVDEFEPLARYSGHPLIQRRSLSHALNIHAVARLASEKIGKKLDETNFVIAHLGGGISVCPVKGGKIIDANDASSDGPFSPERTGGLPLQPFISLCFSGKYTEQEIRKMVMGKGGLVAYLGTNNADEVEKRIQNGDEYAREVYEAMAYQIAKEIGAMATVLKGKVDAVVLTGGLANVLGNIGELMIEEFKLGEAYKHIKEAKELHIKTNNLDGLLETDLLLLSLYLVAGDIKNAELTLNEINQKHPETPPELIECYRACIEMKKKNFAESESILMKLLNNENIKGNDDIYLKILISLLKLNYVTGGIEKLEMVRSIAENYAEQVENFNLKALLFFLISLSYEDKDKSLAVKYLNKSIESLGYEFFEPKWKIYLMLAQNYKRRGIESKFLQSFETALINFQELLQRIETPEFVKSYLADVENEKFLKILQNLKI